MIHLFEIKNIYFVIDVYSGSIHQINRIVFLILSYIQKYNISLNQYKSCPELILIKLLNLYKYNKDEIRQAYSEIIELYKAKLIFTENQFNFINEKKIFNNYNITKALCLNITDFCNMKCQYCFADMNIEKKATNIMSEEVAFKSIDFLVQKSAEIKNLEIDFFGGEPLLAFDLIKKVILYSKKFKNKNFRFTITTNGILLNNEIIDFINEHIDNIILSIDGRKDINDMFRKHKNPNIKSTYDMIIEKFKQIITLRKKNNKDYFIRGTFTNKNLDFSNDFKHFVDLGFNNISLEPILTKNSDYSIKNQDINQIIIEYEKICDLIIENYYNNKKINFYHYILDIYNSTCIFKRIKGCGAGFEYLCINTNGDIYPCHQLSNDSKFKLGNIKNDTNLNNNYIKNFYQSNVINNFYCKKCWAKYYCSGGCISSNYNINGDFNIPYELNCIFLKKRLEYTIYINYILFVQ